jgi:DNA invertase Pin-like site-specific DNA recombinase
MRVAVYARVSTDDKGQDVENQLTVLRDWAKRQGYDEVLEYKDEGISGANSNRPAFIKMRADARQNLFKGILIWSLDRFSREGISQTLAYINELDKYSIFLRSYQETWVDTADPMIKPLLLSTMAWTASFERQRISQRIRAGIQRQKNLGVYKGGRPKKNLTEEDKETIMEFLKKGKSTSYISRRFGISREVVNKYNTPPSTPSEETPTR